jgi:hypothetical protein
MPMPQPRATGAILRLFTVSWLEELGLTGWVWWLVVSVWRLMCRWSGYDGRHLFVSVCLLVVYVLLLVGEVHGKLVKLLKTTGE